MHCDVVGVWLPDAEGSNCANSLRLPGKAMDFPKEDVAATSGGPELGDVFKTGKPFVLRTQPTSPVNLNFRDSVQNLLSGFGSALISRKPNSRPSDTREPDRELVQPGRC